MTSQLRDKNATVIGSSRSDGTLGNIHLNRNYEDVYVSFAEEEELKQRVQKLELYFDDIRGVLTELYNKCPKTMMPIGKNKKKEDAVECENCGGLLW